MFRIPLLVLVVAVLCGGCALVGSRTPVFTAQDGAGTPALRPGVWMMKDAGPSAGPCVFDEAAPAAAWPDCANVLLIQGDWVTGLGDPVRRPDLHVFTRMAAPEQPDDPIFVQMYGVDHETDEPPFAYGGLRPTALDAEGRIIRGDTWMAFCAPPRPRTKTIDLSDPVTPGFVRDTKLGVCFTTDPQQIKDAVRRSEVWSRRDPAQGLVLDLRWVRDSDPAMAALRRPHRPF